MQIFFKGVCCWLTNCTVVQDGFVLQLPPSPNSNKMPVKTQPFLILKSIVIPILRRMIQSS